MAFQKLVDAAALGETLLEGYNVKNITGLSFSGTTVTLSWTDANDASQTTTYEAGAKFTSALATKLAAIEDNAKDDQTATEIKDSLETLSGNDRLDASAVKDLPEGTVASDDTLTGDGTSDDPLKVANPFTSADETKLDGIDAGAEVNVNADWDASSGDAQILNKPTLPTPRTDSEIDARILEPARAGSATRWPANKVQTLAALGGVTSAQAVTIADTRASARFTTTEKNKLRDLPSASQLAFENHPIGTATALNALSRTTSSLDFVTITGAISSEITANTVVDGSGNALTSLVAGDLLILDHDDNRWVRVVNLPTATVVSQNTVRGFIDGDFVEGLLAGLSGASRLSYNSLKDTPAIPAAQVPSDWDATTGVERILNKPEVLTQTQVDARVSSGTLAEARAGNMATWPLAKLPYSSRTADGIVSAAQAVRIDDSIDSAHLHAVPSINAAQLQSGDAFLIDDASVDNDSGSQLKEIDVFDLDTRWAVKPDWNAAAGNKAEVLNKPAAATQAEAEAGTETGTRLWSPSRVSQAIARLAPTAGSGGTATPAELFVIAARPAADVAITRASSERHVWSPFSTIESTAPVAASQAGNVLIIADVHVTVNRSETSDARTEYRLVRTRSSTDETLITEIAGGPSNVSSTDAPWRDATKRDGGAISWHDVAQENDVYKLEARVISNDGTNDRTYTFDRENNGLAVFGVTGGGLGQTQVDARITALRPNEFTSADETKLDGIAAGAEVNVKADWTETDTGSDAFIRNKPTLATVATSGSYDDLGNKPSIPDNAAIDARIDAPARAGNTGRWAKAKLPADTIYTGNQRFTEALATKLNALPNASDIRFDNHPIGTSTAFNALSRTTSGLDFVTITTAIASGIQNAVDGRTGNALTSLAAGDLLVLDHANDRWERVVNLPASATVDQATVRGFIDGGFVQGLLAGLSGASRLSYTSLKDTPAIPAAQVPANWDATTGVARILNKPTIPVLNDDAVLDLAQTVRNTGDRGKYLGTSTTDQNSLALLDAPAGSSNGVLLKDKTISLAAAAGTGVGHRTNRKIVTEANNRVVESEWGDMTFVADASSVGGVTVSTNQIMFANAAKVWIEGSFEFQAASGSDGASRMYNDIRGALTRGASTSHPPNFRGQTFYTKTTAAASSNLAQGPKRQHGEFTWMGDVQAGDTLAIQWRSYLQTNSQADIIAAESNMLVRVAEGSFDKWSGTKSAYDAIAAKDANTIYLITP